MNILLRIGVLLVWPWAATAQGVQADEPRAFGYSVGDLVERRITLDLPSGQRLDTSSLPQVGGRGKALELRSATLSGHELRLVYQVFLAPREVRTLEMPALSLRFTGGTRPATLRVDAWPLTVAPLAPVDVSPRRGLGELRPDTPPPQVDDSGSRRRLVVEAVIAALCLGYLAHVYLGLPWWQRQRRPFGLAWRALRALPSSPTAAQRRAAWALVHRALDRTAGEAMFEPRLAHFLVAHPRFQPLRDELVQFFRRSRSEFFAEDDTAPAPPGAPPTHPGQAVDASPAQLAWLLDFCRACRDLERGAA